MCAVSECDRGISYSRPKLTAAVERDGKSEGRKGRSEWGWRGECDGEGEVEGRRGKGREGEGEKYLQPLRHEFQPHNVKNRDLTSK